MAVYVWRCGVCGNEQEIEKKIADCDVPPNECEKCGYHRSSLSHVWKKLIQPTSFALQGGGWFKDNYQKDKDK